MTRVTKKEPFPTTETGSLDSSIPKKEYTASAREKEEILQRLRNKLNKNHARIPGHYCVGEWRKQIGKAWPLLCVILCCCDWDTGRWRTYEWALAEVIGVSTSCIRKWFRENLQPIGIEKRKLQYGIAIYLPNRLIPNKDRNKRSEWAENDQN